MKKLFMLLIGIIILLALVGLVIKLSSSKLEEKQIKPLNIQDCLETDITCYQELAANGYKDIGLCDNHPARQFNTSIARNYITRCYSWIARNTQNPTICEKIELTDVIDEVDMSINIKKYCIAVSSNNPRACVFIDSGKLNDIEYWQYNCLTDLAQINKNISLCDSLDDYHKTECYVDFAYAYNNVKVCNQLSDQEKITKCKVEFRNLKSNFIPNWIKNIK